MKTMRYISVLMMLSGLLFTACEKDGDDNDDGTNNTLSAMVDGVSFSVSGAAEVTLYRESLGARRKWQLSGVVNQGANQLESIIISMPAQDYNGVGTYSLFEDVLDQPSGQYVLPGAADSFHTDAQRSGILTITSDDGTTAEGTFEFECLRLLGSDTKSVTNGSFKATYTD